jgi:hypothetical protein
MWLPAHLADVESDMSAVHRVDDIDDLPAPKFFSYAWRLPHYRGVMRDRVIALQDDQEDTGPAPAAQARQPARAPAASSQPVTETALSDPMMSKIFDFG